MDLTLRKKTASCVAVFLTGSRVEGIGRELRAGGGHND